MKSGSFPWQKLLRDWLELIEIIALAQQKRTHLLFYTMEVSPIANDFSEYSLSAELEKKNYFLTITEYVLGMTRSLLMTLCRQTMRTITAECRGSSTKN